MKRIRWTRAVLLAAFVLAALPAITGRAGDAPATLSLRDLVNHPERLPDYVTMSDTIRFGGGKRLTKGQRVHTATFDGKTLRASVGGTDYPIGPDECDLLAAANTEWAELTPAQRAVDGKALLTDASLWPATVKVLVPVTIKNKRFPAGTEFTLAAVEPKGVHVYAAENQGGLVGVAVTDTDLLARARALAKVSAADRPSRVAEEFRGKLVGADGSPVAPDFAAVKYFAIYYGANWCPWCHKISPELAKTMTEIGPRNPGLLFVMVNDDDEPSEMLGYMTAGKMPWPAMPKAAAVKVGVVRSMMQIEPQLRIVDHYGNEVFNCPGGGPSQLREDVAALVKLDASGKAR